MPSYALHGLTVETTSTLPADPAALLLAGFPPADTRRAPALTISFTPASGPLPPPAGSVCFRHGGVVVHRGDRGTVVTAPASRLHVSERGDRIDAWLAPAAAARPREVAEGDLMPALSLALGRHGLFHLHAAVTVSPSGRAALIAGSGGAGKSTLATAMVATGHGFLGDDVVLLGPGGTLLAFPRPFHLGPASARAVGVEAGPLRHATGKGDLDADAAFPGRFRWSSPPPGLILLPHVAERPDSALLPATRVEALGALLSLSAFAASSIPGAGEQRARLSALVDGARPFRVALGRDLLHDATGTVRRLEAGLALLEQGG